MKTLPVSCVPSIQGPAPVISMAIHTHDITKSKSRWQRLFFHGITGSLVVLGNFVA
jgi:hypothetical protein